MVLILEAAKGNSLLSEIILVSPGISCYYDTHQLGVITLQIPHGPKYVHDEYQIVSDTAITYFYPDVGVSIANCGA